MSSLVCFDIQPGRRIRLRETMYQVTSVEKGKATLTLSIEAGNGKPLRMTWNELATLLVQEDAELINELEDPDASPRKFTNLSFLTLQRILDWHGKVFLMRQMQLHEGASPKSPIFQQAFSAACETLRNWHENLGIIGGAKKWSAWTIYHDCQRWRSQNFAYAAIQRKGVEYSPWEHRKSDFYLLARKIAEELAAEKPGLCAAALHTQTLSQLAKVQGEVSDD